MTKWEIDELFSKETKEKILIAFIKNYKEEFPKATDEEAKEYFVNMLSGCYLDALLEINTK